MRRYDLHLGPDPLDTSWAAFNLAELDRRESAAHDLMRDAIRASLILGFLAGVLTSVLVAVAW